MCRARPHAAAARSQRAASAPPAPQPARQPHRMRGRRRAGHRPGRRLRAGAEAVRAGQQPAGA
eukprot:6153034-Prymnesium_polylepis.1